MVRLMDVVAALEKRERHEEAFYYGFIVPFQLSLFHGISEDRALEMEIDDVVRKMVLPPEAAEWDNFWVGKSYFGRFNH